MKTFNKIFLLIFLVSAISFSQDTGFNGKWKLIKSQSSDFDYFHSVTIIFTLDKDNVQLVTFMGPKRKYEETISVKTDGKSYDSDIIDGTFSRNLYMGLKLPKGSKKKISANWVKENLLKIKEKLIVYSSQGEKDIAVIHSFELSKEKDIITYTIKRNTRKSGPETKLVFKRFDENNAYVMKMTDDWNINSKLPEQACLISLQGLVNEKKPNLYFTYGPNYTFHYTTDLYNYIEAKKNFSFTKLNSLEQALAIFKDYVKGYIVWDKTVRTSLIVSYTAAGLEKGIVITEEMIPLMQKLGINEIEDFRGKFSGKSDYEIFSWAKDKYWNRCAKDLIVWLGGEQGNVMLPGVADYGMMKKAFFTDLSARQTDTLEYGLANELLSDMIPLSLVMGWHSYKKDWEEEWVTLTSSHALTVEGLNSLPNTSFISKIPPTPGFKFKNHHNIIPGKKYIPENKVYVAFVQTDGIGIGAWARQGRGSIPYAWETGGKSFYFSPILLEMYYAQATPNDYFVGALSGSSYMYPKAFPKKYLPEEIKNAYEIMNKLDLNSFEIMDYAGDRTEAGENNLPKEIIDEYYKGMPGAIGFINGYFTSNTFAVKDKKPFVSFDYYLSAEKSEDEAAADLQELAEINSKRPYFLLVHVREYSDVARVKSICDKLGKDFKVIPLDIFLKMAGENPTFKERYLK